MADIEYGFIAHGNQGLWFQGPLPSPKCARLLAQFYAGIDIQEIPESTRAVLNQKWPFQGDFPSFAARYPGRAKRIKWAIALESIVAQAPEVRAGLALVESLRVPIFNDAGPFFPSTPAENWIGEDCSSSNAS